MKNRITKREQRRRKQTRNSNRAGNQSFTSVVVANILQGSARCFSFLEKPFRGFVRMIFLNQKTLGTLFAFCFIAALMIVFKTKVIDRAYESLPEKIEVSVEDPSLKEALEKSLSELISLGHKKRLTKKQFMEQLEALFSEFPAVNFARQKFLLNGTLQVTVTMQTPTLEIEDSEGKLFVFNEKLLLMGQSPIIGLRRSPLRLRMSDKRLQLLVSKSQKPMLKPAINHRHLFTQTASLHALQLSRSEFFGDSVIEYSEEYGFSFCVRIEKSRCSRIILGPEPNVKNLEDFMTRVSSAKMDSLDSADLRIPGKALIKELDSANKVKEGVE